MAPEEISELQLKLIGSLAPTAFAVTQNRDLLHKAYIGTAHCAESGDYESCMRYDHEEYGLPAGQHPVDAYFFDDPAQSDFALAYTMRDNSIVARAMVLPKSKTYVRVYGNSEIDKQDIKQHLKAAGYKKALSFKGARLCLRPHPSRNKCVIVPYIDGSVQWCDADGYIDAEANAYCCEVTDGYSRLNSSTGYEEDVDDEGNAEPATFYCQRSEEEYSYDECHDISVFVPTNAALTSGYYETWASRFVDDRMYVQNANQFGAWVPCDNPYVVAYLAAQEERAAAIRLALAAF